LVRPNVKGRVLKIAVPVNLVSLIKKRCAGVTLYLVLNSTAGGGELRS
jgi:hypothetical protein